MFRKFVLIIFSVFTVSALIAQSEEGVALLKPVFSETSSGLIYIEGEDAVSTNFANQAVSNFGCSGYRAIQLNRNTGLQGGSSFYAEFVFFVEEEGEYELWFGGTPPGPLDDLIPSYASPVSLSLDGAPPVSVYREDVNVIEGYSPSYYWNRYKTLPLSRGEHRLRFEVSEKRGFDGRFFFYLDSLFFMNRDRLDEIEAVKPDVFPSVLDSFEIDNPFRSINEYQAYIDRNPDELSPYIELSLVYSLVGDYQSALKTLNRAMALAADDPYPVVLAAKNRLWKGDVTESLGLYERALNLMPEDPVLWTEAGKVAAWSAEYDRSISFFKRGLELFPGDLNMMVNLGLTYLWMSRDDEAEDIFNGAFDAAKSEPGMLSRLGWVEEAAGYPEYARDVYRRSIELYPAYLDFYLLLQSSYLRSGDREAADETGRLITSTFQKSEKLESELEIYRTRLNMRDDVIKSYKDKLEKDPGNLELRQELAQTYFWNGMSAEAMQQIRFVLATYSYRSAETFSRRSEDLLKLIDLTAVLGAFFNNFPANASEAERRLSEAADARQKALKALKSAEQAGTGAVNAALQSAGQEYADAVAALRHLISMMEQNSVLADSYRQQADEILEAEAVEAEAFRSAIASSGWFWDKDWQIEELTDVMDSERTLASFMLGLIYLSGQEYGSAVEVLKAEAADNSPAEAAPLYALYQALLLGDEAPEETLRTDLLSVDGGVLKTAYPHIAEVEAKLAESINPFEGVEPGIFYEGLVDESAELSVLLDEQRKNAAVTAKELERLQSQLSAVVSKRLERNCYYLEADTYLIRYELGSYYLDDGMNLEASEQFRRVIAVDPWNISAVYRLGVVEQRYGNWSEAMKYYKKVYLQDPSFENTVNYYNQLARAHADGFNSGVQLITTPSRINLSAELGYRTEFNSILGLTLGYKLEDKRQYTGFTGQQSGYSQVHLIQAGLPLTLQAAGLEIVPSGGLFVDSVFYKIDSSSSLPVDSFAEGLGTFPRFGASVNWVIGVFSIDAVWDNTVEAETFLADRQLTRKNDFSLNMNTWFNLDDSELLGPLTTRTYGRLQLMYDDNIKGQLYQDAMLGFNLLSNPVIRVSPSASVNFETSKTSTVTDYYAPDGVLEAKGNLRASFTFPSSDWSSAFEGVLWGGAGGYWQNLGDADAAGSLKLEGGLGATFIKNSNMYYLNLSGMGTFISGQNEYWEAGISLGTVLKTPGLLTP